MLRESILMGASAWTVVVLPRFASFARSASRGYLIRSPKQTKQAFEGVGQKLWSQTIFDKQ
jgi:hypothetical protein